MTTKKTTLQRTTELRLQMSENRAKKDRLSVEAAEIHERAGDAQLTGGDRERWDNLRRGIAKLNDEHEQLYQEWQDVMRDGLAGGQLATEGDSGGTSGPQIMRRAGDPWAEHGPLTRDHALAALERAEKGIPDLADTCLERATQLVEDEHRDAQLGDASPVAEYITELSNPAYARATMKLFRDPQFGHRQFTTTEVDAYARVQRYSARAMSEGSNAAGAFLVPFHLDPTINLRSSGSTNPVRNVARKVTIAPPSNVWHGITSAGVSAEWIAEATEVADAGGTFEQPAISVYKADAYLQASFELAGDSNIGEQVTMLINDAKDQLEAAAFITGTGTAQPRGLVSALSGSGPSVAGSSGAAGAADFVAADIYALDGALPDRFDENAQWMAHRKIGNLIRQMATGAAANTHSFWCDFGDGRPSTLLGRGFNYASAMDSTIVSGSNDDVLLIGDFTNYVIVDRLGLTVAVNPMVVGANRRPTGEIGWLGWWRTGADVLTSNAFRLLRL